MANKLRRDRVPSNNPSNVQNKLRRPSEIGELEIVCPECKEKSVFRAYRTVHVTDANKEVKEKVLNGSLFIHECPHCQIKINIDYSFLYHQPEDALYIHYLCNDKEFQDVGNMFTKPDANQKMMVQKLINENSLIRLVRNRMEIAEKITIYDAGMDDRAIEILKVHIGGQFSKENPDKKISGMFFNASRSEENPEEFTAKYIDIFVDNKRFARADVGADLYKKIVNDYLSAMPPLRADRNVTVNFGWARSVVQLKNAKPNPADGEQ